MAVYSEMTDRQVTSTSLAPRLAIARLTVAIVTVMIVLTALAASVWRPDLLAALTLFPPWCWLVIGMLSLPLLWRIGYQRLAYGLAAFWLIFAVALVEELPSLGRAAMSRVRRSSSVSTDNSIRIVSLNCAGSERCIEDLMLARPDIALLQETPGEEALARMTAELFGEQGEFCKAGDVAILSRGAVLQQSTDKSGTFVAALVQLADAKPVHCISLRLAPPPSRLDFWTLGFWTEHRDLRQRHRSQLVAVVVSFTDLPIDRPIVIGGDFNTLPHDAALDQLRPRLRDAFVTSGLGWGATGTNDWPLFRVDQIWAGARVLPKQTYSAKSAHSDHRLVICDTIVEPLE
jgi:hypothetical protein